ncbi:universal stress protein [Mucilaginibacter sp.]|jgi:nucleotide-binding universal stress UspA family protein|uniref:universal stress protein n=1 Tax=Mucilaginibacter sp. TaxID=1882438 RepID=UPI0035624CAF
MKKLSAAFDGLKFSEGTMKYAIRMAADNNALLTGVFLESFLYHSFHLFDMVGSQGVSKVKLRHLLEKDRETRRNAAARFREQCQQIEVECAIHHDKVFALDDLVKESIYSDLLLIGAHETVNNAKEAPPTAFICDLLAEAQCPVMVVPQKYTDIQKVILLYDGSPSSVYAVKMFNYLLPFLRELETEVIYVSQDETQQELPEKQLIREFIRCHYPKAQYKILFGNPETEIISYLKKAELNTLVVLGAYQRGVVSRWFKSSMADKLMQEELSIPLFIAHYR